jgi:hypothetical protein
MRTYEGRVLGVAGAADALLAHPDAMRRFCDGFGPGRVDFRVAGRRSGLSIDPDHGQIGCDARCTPAWQAVGRWIADAVDA